MKSTIEKVWKEAKNLSQKEQLELIEKLVRQMKNKEIKGKKDVSWNDIYGIGKGIWDDEDAQSYVNRLREERE